MSLFYIITILFSIIGMIVSNLLKSKFNKYSRIPISAGLSGAEVAKNMLSYYGIHDVKIQVAHGILTDHYNPLNKTVNLSADVYNGRSIASAAVAAHECGHAVQHATKYPFLQLRSGIVPIVKIASIAQQYLLFVAFITLNTMPQIMWITVIAFGITTLFSFLTLPVEFDASNRALKWLKSSGIAVGEEYQGAKDALKWAAMTYVVAALSALVMFIYL
ncbi:MAG TPA: zinc metallopeptidase, partial [Bacteroidetes bacterium]|nr:zinc metallopeptidase [Bacteroidota bacterium]